MTTGLDELAVSVGMALAAGLVGCFAVMRKMTLASDAISHVALPGIGIALILHLPPVVGGMTALLLGTLLVWAVQAKTHMTTETVIGVVFSAALAVGALFTNGEHLLEALFGGSGSMGVAETTFGIVAAIGVATFIVRQRHRLVIALVSRDLARTAGIDVSRLELWYLVTFSITVGLGLRYLGVLLMGSLIIIPAATAKHLARGMNAMLAIAVAVAIFATVAGTSLAHATGHETGPVIIAVAAALFFVSLLKRRA